MEKEIGPQTRIEMNKYDSIAKIVEQLEKCEYECEGGPLINNVAFLRLKEISEMDREAIVKAADAFMNSYKWTSNSISEFIINLIADFAMAHGMIAQYPLTPQEAFNAETLITKEGIIKILQMFQEQTMMKGRMAIPPKNFEHVANYIIKEIQKNLKGEEQ